MCTLSPFRQGFICSECEAFSHHRHKKSPRSHRQQEATANKKSLPTRSHRQQEVTTNKKSPPTRSHHQQEVTRPDPGHVTEGNSARHVHCSVCLYSELQLASEVTCIGHLSLFLLFWILIDIYLRKNHIHFWLPKENFFLCVQRNFEV